MNSSPFPNSAFSTLITCEFLKLKKSYSPILRWADLDAIKRVVEKHELDMEVIVNPKHLERGVDVIQLETAAGAAIKNFKNSCGINVPRSRFLPVKKTSDLLLLMSNLYEIENGTLTLSSLRSFPTTPLVKLGNQFDKASHVIINELMSFLF